MRKLILSVFFSLAYIGSASADLGVNVGVSGQAGLFAASATESTGATVKGNGTEHGSAGWGSVFLEATMNDRFMVGIDYVPVDADLGEGKRTDASGSASPGAEDTGDRSASAEMNDLFTYYVTKTLGGSGYYILLGYHDAEITTTETLPASKYGDVDLNGYQYGIGFKTPVCADGAIRYEFSFSDFDDIAITDSTNSKNKVTADADAYMIKVGYNF